MSTHNHNHDTDTDNFTPCTIVSQPMRGAKGRFMSREDERALLRERYAAEQKAKKARKARAKARRAERANKAKAAARYDAETGALYNRPFAGRW